MREQALHGLRCVRFSLSSSLEGADQDLIAECRNNLQPTYDPRQADIWSLGLVLLNLLYHRNPWADPSLDDPDFADYVRDPHGFLQDRFEGIGEEVSFFLADRVFCDVLEMEGDSMRKRVTAGEFGRWAGRLVMMMGEGKRKRASVSDHTFHLFATSSKPGQHHGAKSLSHPPVSNAPGLLSQYAPATTTSPGPIEDRLSSDGSELETVQEVEEKRAFAPSSLSPPASPRRVSRSPPPPLAFVTEDDDDLPSPSFPPQASDLRAASPASPPPTSPRPRLDHSRQESFASSSQSRETDEGHDREPEALEDDREGGDVRCWGEPETVNPKSKRRKRGARKGKSSRTPGTTSPPTPSPLSPASPHTVPSVGEQRDQVLADLAAASQNLARELSKATRSFGTQSTSALSSSTSTEEKVATAKKAAKSGGVFGRMKNLVKDGNPDLLAFKQRVEERNASIGAKADTYSAPAKLQGRHAMSGGSVEVGGSSRGSVGSASWGAGSADEDVLRGRTKGDLSPGHWTSASSRRERLDKQRQRPFDLSPSSSTRNGTLSTSTFDSRNHTPLSSFSSVASGDLIAPHHNSSSIATVRDWRQPSPHPRPYSTSRPPLNEELSSSTLTAPKLSPSLPILHSAPLKARPKLKDAAVDTRDLNPVVTSSPLPPVLVPSPVKMIRPPGATAKDKETPSKNKLAKMLNSISVFNRSQERQVPAT